MNPNRRQTRIRRRERRERKRRQYRRDRKLGRNVRRVSNLAALAAGGLLLRFLLNAFGVAVPARRPNPPQPGPTVKDLGDAEIVE